MASVLATELRAKSTGVALAYHAKLLDFTSVRNIKFVFNPFHERVESIRLVIGQKLRAKLLYTECVQSLKIRYSRLGYFKPCGYGAG